MPTPAKHRLFFKHHIRKMLVTRKRAAFCHTTWLRRKPWNGSRRSPSGTQAHHCRLAKLTETIVRQTSAQWNTFRTSQSSVPRRFDGKWESCCAYLQVPSHAVTIGDSHSQRLFGRNAHWSFPRHVPFDRMLFWSWVIYLRAQLATFAAGNKSSLSLYD